MTQFSNKTRWERLDGWRGLAVPIQAIARVPDTGSWEDSPYPTKAAERELNEATTALLKAGINYQIQTCETTNAFCVHHYIKVLPKDKDRAINILTQLQEHTWMLSFV